METGKSFWDGGGELEKMAALAALLFLALGGVGMAGLTPFRWSLIFFLAGIAAAWSFIRVGTDIARPRVVLVVLIALSLLIFWAWDSLASFVLEIIQIETAGLHCDPRDLIPPPGG